jgi:hypothetical protein
MGSSQRADIALHREESPLPQQALQHQGGLAAELDAEHQAKAATSAIAN